MAKSDRPIGEYDAARSKREMAKPVISQENIDTVKAPFKYAASKARGLVSDVKDAGHSFMKAHRSNMRRLRGGKR